MQRDYFAIGLIKGDTVLLTGSLTLVIASAPSLLGLGEGKWGRGGGKGGELPGQKGGSAMKIFDEPLPAGFLGYRLDATRDNRVG